LGSVEDYFRAMPHWGSVPEPSQSASAPEARRRSLETAAGTEWPFDCQVVTHDIVAKHEEILNLDSGAAYVKPGMLLVGSNFVQGTLQPIPLPRAPIILSINVPGVSTATVTVEDPNLSNIQQGIATLQAQAEAAANDSYAAQLSYEQHTVQSMEEMAFKLGVSGSFDGGLASASFSAQFANEETEEKYTVVSKLMQQMYTITFAQDSFQTARDFFSDSLTLDEVSTAEENGFLSLADVPVFIGSVTYGRMVVFTATSTQASSSTELQSSLQAAGTSWSASADLSAEQKSLLASLDIEVLSIGGNQTNVTNAIKTGDWSDLYAGADILNAVPLRYTVYALSGTRPIAAIGDTTQFTSADCSAVQGWYPSSIPTDVIFTDISTNPTNAPVFAVGQTAGEYKPYRLEGEELVLVPGYQSTGALDVSVDDAGNTFLYDPVNASFRRLPSNGTTWSTYTSANTSMLVFDAGAPDWIVALSHTYSDNQNDLWRLDWGQSWQYWLDESQNMKIGQAPYFSAVGAGYIGRHGGGLYHRINDGNYTELSLNSAELDSVELLSAASVSEIYGLRIGTGQVVRWNDAADEYDRPIDPPEGKSIARIEATSNGRLWALTTDGQLYAYSPPR
jgi:hypothetical protein